MAYGLNLYKSDSTILFSTSDLGYVLIDRFDIASGASTTRYYTDYTGRTVYASSQNNNSIGGHVVSVSGTTLYVTPTNLPSPPAAASNGPSVISVFAR